MTWWKRDKQYEEQQDHDITVALEQRRRADRAKDRAIDQGRQLQELTDEFTRAYRKSYQGRHA
jgi:hypothetical protein